MNNSLRSSTRRASFAFCILGPWLLSLSGCGEESAAQGGDQSDEPTLALAGESIDCTVTAGTGYRNNAPFPVELIKVDGKLVTIDTANHYVAMQRAAAAAGVRLSISDGFRTMERQQYFWNCYQTKSCNNGNEAARPGYGNHQNGIALDINLGSGVEAWLRANARRFGFEARLANEPWHWERNFDGEWVEACPGAAVGSDGCTDQERENAAKFGCACVDHKGNGGFCEGHGCTAIEEQNCAAFGTACVDHQCNGGFAEGHGCTALEEKNCAAFGTACVDHQCNGGFAEGHGCTALEEKNCAAFGTACVDHQCNGGFAEGHGCTALEEKNCASVATQCVDHQCSGGFAEGHGCTALEEKNCASVATQCVDHQCSGGLGAVGNGCTAREQTDCDAKGQDCRDHACVAR